MENEIKEVVSPKGLKPKNQRKRAPKPMKEEEEKKKKKVQIRRWKKNQRKREMS